MESSNHGDNVLLGYTSERAFLNISSSPKTPTNDSEVDFSDVFGGPPRRCSFNHESRYSFSETVDFDAGGEDGDDRAAFTDPWSGFSEKPVFGEEGLHPRRYKSDDFYKDIFRGDESSSSTPRKAVRDPFRSAPGSRVLSPARSLPPRPELLGNSSLPTQFSLPAKLVKGMEFPATASLNRSLSRSKDGTSNAIGYLHSPSTSMSRFSIEAVHAQDDLRTDAQSANCRSPLSNELSHSSEGSSKAMPSDKLDIDENLKNDSNDSEVLSHGQFHFSIYKWASKGVPLVMPFRRKEKGKTESCLISNKTIDSESMTNELPEATLVGVDSASMDSSISVNTKSFRMECEKQDSGLLLDTGTPNKAESCQIVEEADLVMPELKSLESLQSDVIITNIPGNTMPCNSGEEIEPHSLLELGLSEGNEKEISLLTGEHHKPISKVFHSLFQDKNRQDLGDDGVTRKAEGKGITEKATKRTPKSIDAAQKVKEQNGRRRVSKQAEVDNASLQGSPTNSGNKLGNNGIKGKVKEFVKIFNQETSSKPIIKNETQSQSFRWKGTRKSRSENTEGGFCSVDTDETKRMPNASKKKGFADASVKVEENCKQSRKQHRDVTSTCTSSDTSSGPKNSSDPSESVSSSTEAILSKTDDSFQGYFMVKELSPDQDKAPQQDKLNEDIKVKDASTDQDKLSRNDNLKEAIKESDVRIRQWSSGKEGNIRSLLSTLQYVLWPESGWKPVPLVDIIEGNSVRRAYQKAMLCLHPDKLQQKGAASHQKYIAEKVFDILQEAWDHFNSLGTL